MFKREFIRSLGAQIARKLVKKRMLRQCSWCGKYRNLYSLTIAYFYPELRFVNISHGICNKCIHELKSNAVQTVGKESEQ